jgi:hypothetical protein
MSTPDLARLRRLVLRAGGQRLALVAVAVAVPVLVTVAIAAGGGGSEAPPAIGAAAVVPSDALAYVHLSIDGTRPAVKRGLTLAARFPDYPLAQAAVIARLSRIGARRGGRAVEFARDIRPWLGKEAAISLLDTATSTAGSLIVLDVANRAGAERFLRGATPTAQSSYRSTPILMFGPGTETAFVGHYLAIGQAASVRSAIDSATGSSPALQTNPSYQRAVSGEPAGRVLDAYASAAGVRRLLAPQGGVVGALGALLYQPALVGVSLAISPVAGGARVRVHSALDPKLAHGGRRFTPTLLKDIPLGAELVLDTNQLDQAARQLFNASSASGVLSRIGPLLQRLGGALQAQGIDVQRDVVSVFHQETAVAIGPSSGRTTGAAGRRPTLVIVARTPNEAQTRTAFAQLEAPLAQLFGPIGAGSGQSPVFNDRQVAGISAHQLVLGPGLELDYAVFDGKLVISTSLDGIANVRSHAHSLLDDPRYGATLGSRRERLTSLLFLDFSQLLSLGEQTGLTGSARYRALRPDLQRINAIGLSSTSGEADSTAELFLQIS